MTMDSACLVSSALIGFVVGAQIVRGLIYGVVEISKLSSAEHKKEISRLERELKGANGINAQLMNAVSKLAAHNKELQSVALRYKSLYETQCAASENYRISADMLMSAVGGGVLDKKEIDEMLKLCHPDRHPKNAEAANKVTKKLLELRKKAI